MFGDPPKPKALVSIWFVQYTIACHMLTCTGRETPPPPRSWSPSIPSCISFHAVFAVPIMDWSFKMAENRQVAVSLFTLSGWHAVAPRCRQGQTRT